MDLIETLNFKVFVKGLPLLLPTYLSNAGTFLPWIVRGEEESKEFHLKMGMALYMLCSAFYYTCLKFFFHRFLIFVKLILMFVLSDLLNMRLGAQ